MHCLGLSEITFETYLHRRIFTNIFHYKELKVADLFDPMELRILGECGFLPLAAKTETNFTLPFRFLRPAVKIHYLWIYRGFKNRVLVSTNGK
jgi:hypothetical protein